MALLLLTGNNAEPQPRSRATGSQATMFRVAELSGGFVQQSCRHSASIRSAALLTGLARRWHSGSAAPVATARADNTPDVSALSGCQRCTPPRGSSRRVPHACDPRAYAKEGASLPPTGHRTSAVRSGSGGCAGPMLQSVWLPQPSPRFERRRASQKMTWPWRSPDHPHRTS